MPRKTRKQMRRQRLRTLRKFNKRKGGYAGYTYLIDYLNERSNQTKEGVTYVLNELRGREGSYLESIDYWRNFFNQLSPSNRLYNEHLKDAISDLKTMMRRLDDFAKNRRGGSDSQSLIPPTQGFKIAAPVNSDNIWHKIA